MKVKTIYTAILWLSAWSLPAFGQLSADDAGAIFTNFYSAFHVNGGEYKWQQGGSFNNNDFWENAEMIEMTIDRYLAAPNAADSNDLTSILNAFDGTYTGGWTATHIYNDDVMWAVLAHARAYVVMSNLTGTVTASMAKWAINASNNFCWVYNGGPGRANPQCDNTYGGGIWWTNNSSSASDSPKNSCVNGPAALAAYYLNQIFPSAGFWAMGSNLINWENHYLVLSNGKVYDHYDAGGQEGSDLSYNAGTYVGAAGLLGLGIPNTAATYYTNTVKDILPNYGTGGNNNDGFNAIFLRWVGTYELLAQHNSNWDGFFFNQAGAAWAVTNAAGLSWDNWTTPTPASGSLYSWDCSVSVSALQWAQIAAMASPQTLGLAKAVESRPQLSWTFGTLQSATNLAGPYNDVPGASSPYTIPAANSQQFYRIREN